MALKTVLGRPAIALAAAAATVVAVLLPSAPAGAAPDASPRAAEAQATRPFVYGITIADASPAAGRSFDLARRAGFTHAYVVLDWASVQPERSRFAWDMGRANDLDNFLAAARASGMRLIVRLGRPPAWAGAPAALSPADMEAHAAGVAARARGIATAYEIFNEPNLAYEWGAAPDPARYAQLLAAASRGVKRGDPNALVIAAGLAPNTGNAPGTLEDVEFLRGLYAAGARGQFDVLGIHPYGGNSAPDADPAQCGICFRRAELYRQVMVEHGDAATPVWITEFGYLHTTTIDLGQYNWLKVSPDLQASYLTAAFRYGYEQWPWLAGMVAFNLDFDTVPWNPHNLGAYWFALLNPDRSPRPAYLALRDLPKPGAAAPLPASTPATVSPATSSTPAPPMPSTPANSSSASAASSTSSTPSPVQIAASTTGDIACRTSGGKAICGLAAALTTIRK